MGRPDGRLFSFRVSRRDAGLVLVTSTTQVHFVGFRDDAEYWAAVRVFGRPDFIHLIHDKRLYGDVDTSRDVVIIARRATLEPVKWTDQDHQRH